jgi:hypothetical protein
MRLSSLRVVAFGPFDDLTLRVVDANGAPRLATVVFGGDGTGKTSLLTAILATRPGHVLPPVPGKPGFAVAEWILGDDDPARPHALRVASPNARLEDEDDAATTVRRREQAHFDRQAQEVGGFVAVALSGTRWFSRSANLLSAPERNLGRWDVRATTSFDDATRADLARETKQVLSWATIAAALEGDSGGEGTKFASLRASLVEVCDALLDPFGVTWTGASPASLEPTFAEGDGACAFEDLPKGARHLLAIGVATVRALYAAYPEDRGPVRDREGLVLVDDLETQLEPRVQRRVVSMLRRALPRVQWVLTTSSPDVTLGCEEGQVVALRKSVTTHGVELHEGPLAVIH